MWPIILALPLFGTFKSMAYFGPIMKTLIIHPEDPTTTFLSKIYAQLTCKTLIRGGISKSEIQKLIESHDRVLMLGHGSPYGLLSQGQFPDAGLLIIDDSLALTLKAKRDNVYIWCHADQFVQRHGLTGLNSGMFISDGMEARYYNFKNMDLELIDQSNDRFAAIFSKYLNEPMEILYQKLVHDYEFIARTNPITRFNLERLYLTCSGTNINRTEVVK
jgi:hypothetical protein